MAHLRLFSPLIFLLLSSHLVDCRSKYLHSKNGLKLQGRYLKGKINSGYLRTRNLRNKSDGEETLPKGKNKKVHSEGKDGNEGVIEETKGKSEVHKKEKKKKNSEEVSADEEHKEEKKKKENKSEQEYQSPKANDLVKEIETPKETYEEAKDSGVKQSNTTDEESLSEENLMFVSCSDRNIAFSAASSAETSTMIQSNSSAMASTNETASAIEKTGTVRYHYQIESRTDTPSDDTMTKIKQDIFDSLADNICDGERRLSESIQHIHRHLEVVQISSPPLDYRSNKDCLLEHRSFDGVCNMYKGRIHFMINDEGSLTRIRDTKTYMKLFLVYYAETTNFTAIDSDLVGMRILEDEDEDEEEENIDQNDSDLSSTSSSSSTTAETIPETTTETPETTTETPETTTEKQETPETPETTETTETLETIEVTTTTESQEEEEDEGEVTTSTAMLAVNEEEVTSSGTSNIAVVGIVASVGLLALSVYLFVFSYNNHHHKKQTPSRSLQEI